MVITIIAPENTPMLVIILPTLIVVIGLAISLFIIRIVKRFLKR